MTKDIFIWCSWFVFGVLMTIGVMEIHAQRAQAGIHEYEAAFQEICPQLEGLEKSLPTCIDCHVGCEE